MLKRGGGGIRCQNIFIAGSRQNGLQKESIIWGIVDDEDAHKFTQSCGKKLLNGTSYS
jgi:hypothetical protein